MAMIKKDIGAYSAYAIAVKHGYKGTEAEWIAAQEQARVDSQAAAKAAQAAQEAAETAKTGAEKVLESIPQDYTATVEEVERLKDDLDNQYILYGFEKSVNLLNPNTTKINYGLKTANGREAPDTEGCWITGFIPLANGERINLSAKAYKACFYNQDKGWTYTSTWKSDYYAGREDSCYVRLMFIEKEAPFDSISKFMVNIGDALLPFEPYYMIAEKYHEKTVSFGDKVLKRNWTGSYAYSDMTFVGDELWHFTPSNDEHTSYEKCYRYSLSGSKLTELGTFEHNFGHCNSVDYCDANDTLIMGNAGRSTNTQHNQIYIIKNASALKNNAQNALENVALVIDLDNIGLDWGKQLNVCWGHDDNERYDIAICLSNNGKTQKVRVIQLGKGSNALTYGERSNASSNDFNGTFNIISDAWERPYRDAICNQGMQMEHGRIYEAVGHDGLKYAIHELCDDGSWNCKYMQKSFYLDNGNRRASITPNGLCINDGLLFIGFENSHGIVVYKFTM